jgi:hypothetical protein
MPFKLPSAPSPKARPHELADFAELLAWDRGSTSAREVVRALNQADDNDSNEGCEDDEVENTNNVDDVFIELENRATLCGDTYPFRMKRGQRLEHKALRASDRQAVVYRFLLLCTRLNMANNRSHADLDGTKLFEELSAEGLREYLGSERSKAMVFGTSVGGAFAGKVEELCAATREGGSYQPVDASGSTANDGKLDAIAWVPFGDLNPGKLILFGQSKTGTSWQEEITRSRPLDFARKWFSRGCFWVEPVRALCVAESVDPERWPSVCIDGGLIMDRCRLVELSCRLEPPLFTNILRWTKRAKQNTPVTVS